MLDQADDFVRASGALAVRCYREEIEAALRTSGFGGFHRLGLLWEARIGSGKLLVCSSDLLGHKDQPAVRQFYQSLLDYAASPAFQPTTSITFEDLENLEDRPTPPDETGL